MGEGPREKVKWRRFARERPSKKVYEKRVAGKVALIPCEEKNNSLIFID